MRGGASGAGASGAAAARSAYDGPVAVRGAGVGAAVARLEHAVRVLGDPPLAEHRDAMKKALNTATDDDFKKVEKNAQILAELSNVNQHQKPDKQEVSDAEDPGMGGLRRRAAGRL